MSSRTLVAALWAILFARQPAAANAQEFPSRNVNFVVPFAAGTATDAVARWLGDKVSEELGRFASHFRLADSTLVADRVRASSVRLAFARCA